MSQPVERLGEEMRLYHCLEARSFRALWALEELEWTYELEMLPFPPRVHRKTYLEHNPLGTVPLLVDGDSRLTESSAICHYLSTIRPSSLAVLPGEPDYAGFLNALYQSDATLTFPQTLVLRYGQLEPEDRRSPQIVDDYSRWFHARMRSVDARLADHEFIAAERFTVADIAIGYALKLAGIIGLDRDFSPRLTNYWSRLASRPAYARADEAQQVAYRESMGA